MSDVIQGIRNGNVTLQAFVNVKDAYKREHEELRKTGVPCEGWYQKLNELQASIKFCDNFIKHYETIARSK